MRRVTRMNASCHAYGWVMSYAWICHLRQRLMVSYPYTNLNLNKHSRPYEKIFWLWRSALICISIHIYDVAVVYQLVHHDVAVVYQLDRATSRDDMEVRYIKLCVSVLVCVFENIIADIHIWREHAASSNVCKKTWWNAYTACQKWWPLMTPVTHVTHMNGSCDTHEWVMWHTWMSDVTHKWVMS